MDDPRVTRVRSLPDRFSGGDLEVLSELVAPEFFTYVPAAGEPTATEVYRAFASDFKSAAPDLRVEIPDLEVGPDGVLSGEALISGTWTNELWNVPPSGERYEFRLPLRARSVGDRFAFEIGLETPDVLVILRSLGLVNPPDEMHLPPPHPVDIPEFLFRVLFTGQAGDKPCSHLTDAAVLRTDETACEDCTPGEVYPTARLCLTCGYRGCCDTSTNKHAKAHWEEAGHPLIRSIREDEGWIWCYEDSAFFERRTLERLARGLGETL